MNARAVVADRDEAVDVGTCRRISSQRPLAVRPAEPFEEQLFALQRAADRPPERRRAAARASAISSEFGRLMTSGSGSSRDPLDQLVELLAQHAAVALEHRERQVAEQLGIGRDGAARERADDARRVQQAIEKPRRAAGRAPTYCCR